MKEKITQLIQPAPVQRDELGYWSHPDLPTFAGTDDATEDSPEWIDWLLDQRLVVSFSDLEDEPEEHPAYIRYCEGDPDVRDWSPEPPDENKWFLLAIDATEDGARAWFARRIEA